LPGVACHITQRGVDRRETFSSEEDRLTYLRLVRENLSDAGVALLGWCLVTNHVHLVALPAQEASLSVLLRRVHGRYAQYYNARAGRTGHLWQNRYFACVLAPTHLWTALLYVEQNPLRAGLVRRAAAYPWSSAAAHVTGLDPYGILDMEWWRRQEREGWEQLLETDAVEPTAALTACTCAGRPFGDDAFVSAMGDRFGRQWTRGRPRKAPAGKATKPVHQSQSTLF